MTRPPQTNEVGRTARAARLNAALRLTYEVPAEVIAVGAADFLADVRLEPGTLTVVWHSVMRQYVPPNEWALVERELRTRGGQFAGGAFAHVAFEPRRGRRAAPLPADRRARGRSPALTVTFRSS